MAPVQIFKMSNGIRVVFQPRASSNIVHCGIFLDVGSRDESITNQGIAHFWEHMAFKGTKRRNAYHILTSLDSVGGELNAYTDKEKVVFYASVRDQYFEKAVDVLSDISFNSIFPEAQIEKERGVILEEMSMYLDNPDDSLQDEFESVIFNNHPMGMNILGRPDTVSSFRRRDFIRFCKDHIDTSKIVFSCVGNLSMAQVERVCKKYFEFRSIKSKLKRKKFSRYKAREIELKRPVKQARCGIGRDAYSIHHENRIPFFMLVNLLGGPGMNSRLNLSLRERRGYVYSVEAFYFSYSDTGMFSVFFGTEPKQLDKCVNLVRMELNKLADMQLSPRQLKQVKEQIKGQLSLAEESNLNMMLMMGRSVLDLGRVPSQEEIFEKVQQVNAQQLRLVAEEMFSNGSMSFLKMIPNGKI